MTNRQRVVSQVAFGLAALTLVVLAGCTNEKLVYRDRFNPPADDVNGFLGYFTISDKQTTCGNCHIGTQTSWVETKHAHAWEDLQNSGHAAASCEGCHTTNENGNLLTEAAGYNLIPDSSYHDVQCEACHGPGLTHVENPEASQPLASIVVGTGLTNGCGECHSGAHTPFVEQWEQSAHGSGPGFDHAASNATCAPCHEGRTAMAVKFGETANYIEKDSATLQRIVCAVCHNPHGSPYEHQLRRSISEPSQDNLCVTCHSRQGTPPWSASTSTARGAHGAQGLLVLGINVGWIPPNFAYDTSLIVSSHGTSGNPSLCATCHVARTTVTDNITGAFTFQSVGHLFEAIPCLDANGIPTAGGNCTLSERDFSACATSGCHAATTAARSAFIAVQSRLDNLLDQLWLDSDDNGVIDGTDGGLLAQMVARNTAADQAALDFSSNVTTVAKGALFNAALAATDDRENFLGGKVYGIGFSTHAAAGNGVHNPFLLEALLTSSISAVRSAYGLSAPAPVDLSIHATPPPGLKLRPKQ